MQRRDYLAAVGTAVLGGLAGCTAPVTRRAGGREEAPGSVSLPVPESALQRAAPRDGIPAIDDPAFGPDWEGVTVTARDPFGGEPYTTEVDLSNDDEVIGVARGGGARAYPLKLLNYHEVVNDRFGGPLLVTYCPLCGSGVVAERRVDGVETRFGVSGLLWRDDLVLYDALTGSLWSQILGRAIRGPETGRALSLVPATLTTLGSWREAHPDVEVLLPPPRSGTVRGEVAFDYDRDPYPRYDGNDALGVSNDEFADDRLHPKTRVLGVAADGVATAYPYPVVAEAGVVNDVVGDRPVVVATVGRGGEAGETGGDEAHDADGLQGTLVAYDRRVDGRTLTFAPAGDSFLRAGGSRWSRVAGRAVDGPFEGRRLDPATRRSPMFWFAWVDFHPDTSAYGLAGE